MAGVDVSGVREARLAATALRGVDADLRKAVNASTRSVVNPVWREAVQSRTRAAADRRVLGTGARVAVGTRPALVAASSRRALRGGLVPVESWQGWEFGAKRNERVTYRGRSPKGKRYDVTRRTKRQLPERAKGGRVLYPAVGEVAPRVLALWSQTAVWLVFEALKEGE